MLEFKVWGHEYIEEKYVRQDCFCSGCMNGTRCEYSYWDEYRVKAWVPASERDIAEFYEIQEAFAAGIAPAPLPQSKVVRPRMEQDSHIYMSDYRSGSGARTFIKRQERRLERRNAKWEIQEFLA